MTFNLTILANVALPTVFGHLIGMIVAVWPVIALEAIFIRQLLKQTDPSFPNSYYSYAFNACFHANLKSTIVGMPLAYIFSVACVLPAAFIAPPLYNYLPEWLEKIGLFFATIFLMGSFSIIEDGQISILSSTLLLIP
ncbi:MAG: hypothetical protein GY869_18640, partial [Planctomycetes bacterium]|nr:hypothetical protein [Planctomycetota bacterium]